MYFRKKDKVDKEIRGLIVPRLLGSMGKGQIRMLCLPVIKFKPIVKIKIHFFSRG